MPITHYPTFHHMLWSFKVLASMLDYSVEQRMWICSYWYSFTLYSIILILNQSQGSIFKSLIGSQEVTLWSLRHTEDDKTVYRCDFPKKCRLICNFVYIFLVEAKITWFWKKTS